mgnify:CR=1 FL=1
MKEKYYEELLNIKPQEIKVGMKLRNVIIHMNQLLILH